MFDLYFAGGPSESIDRMVLDAAPGCCRLFSYIQPAALTRNIQWRKEYMAKFDLYFAGSQSTQAGNMLKEKSCNRLGSQLNDRKLLEEYMTARESGYVGKILVDSGAFTAHTKGIEINCDDYIDYLNSIHEYVDLYAQLDKIPGEFGKERTPEQLAEAPKLSWENYLYMRPRLIEPDKLLPIYHQGEDIKWLHNMLETTFDGKHIPYIGISPSNDKSVSEKVKWIEQVFKVIKHSSNPDVKTHAFGMTSLKVLERYPFTSADSTSWIMNGVNGSIFTPYGTLVVSENRRKDPHHIDWLGPDAKKECIKYFEKCGYTYQQVVEDYKVRLCLNIIYLKNWADNYTFKGNNMHKKHLV